MSVVSPERKAAFLDRFRLLRTLGRGGEGVVYLAHDPTLDRQVAIKTLNLDRDAHPGHAEALFAAAKIASGLSHPNIVPVYEYGIHAGQPFVVFEYVDGKTLADLLRSGGPLPMGQAVIWMSQVLAGLAHVHASGLIHGDIKPANILIAANGIPRVTDFGISRRAVSAAVDAVSAGTVQYMAPECFSEGHADCRMDVYALGLVFHEMLTGEPVVGAGNAYAQMYRILNESPTPPSARNPRIDARIDAIVLKALQRLPAERYADAAEMKRDLDQYRVPAQVGKDSELEERTVHSTVEFLLRRMALKSDFPTLSASFSRLNQLSARADEASTKSISELVMRDFALAQKLLRVVNSAAFGAGKVTKVSQAITLLGMAQLRSIATGLMLSQGGRRGAQSPQVAAALTEAFVAGVIARNVGRLAGLAAVEELFICGMFSRLGELLVLFYLVDEHAEIERRIGLQHADPASAASAVLGLTYEQLGAEVARHWNFPDTIVQALQALPRGTLAPPEGEAGRIRYCTAYAAELCWLARTAVPAMRSQGLADHAARFAVAISIGDGTLRMLIEKSVEVALKYVAASGLNVSGTPLLEGLAALRAGVPGTDTAANDALFPTSTGPGVRSDARPRSVAAVVTAPSAASKPASSTFTSRIAQALRSMF
jgi:serine/threonine protein kinase